MRKVSIHGRLFALPVAVLLGLLAGNPAYAFLTEGQIVTLGLLERGEITVEQAFFLNGLELGVVFEGPTPLEVGDTLEVFFSSVARSGATPEDPGEAQGFTTIDFDLASGAQQARLLVTLTTTVSASGEDAFAVGGLNFNCSGAWACGLGGSGGLPEVFGKEVTSDTVLGNGTQEFDDGVPDPFMPNGSFGGSEPLNFQQSFIIDQALAPSSLTRRLSVGLTWNLAAISSTAEISHALAVTVTAVPLPGVAWLFGPGLIAGLAWMRRQQRVR